MKVILKKDVKNVGKQNEIVDVADGYAKNFLIKNKYAVSYNDQNVIILEKDLKELKLNEAENVEKALLLKEKLEAITLVFGLKTNNGAVFGHISNKAILEEINKTEKLIDKHMLAEPYKLTIGSSTVVVNIYKDVAAKIKVNVKAL